MIGHWKDKTKNSPYRVDLNLLADRRAEIRKERDHHKNLEKERERRMRELTGTPKFDITDHHRHHEDTETVLSLKLRNHNRELETLRFEKQVMSDIIHEEIEHITQKFPRIALAVASRNSSRRGTKPTTALITGTIDDYSVKSGTLSTSSFEMNQSIPSVSKMRTTPTQLQKKKEIEAGFYDGEGRYNEFTGRFEPNSEKRHLFLPEPTHAKSGKEMREFEGEIRTEFSGAFSK